MVWKLYCQGHLTGQERFLHLVLFFFAETRVQTVHQRNNFIESSGSIIETVKSHLQVSGLVSPLALMHIYKRSPADCKLGFAMA